MTWAADWCGPNRVHETDATRRDREQAPFVPDHGQYDRACPNCPNPDDCELNGDCQLAWFSGREDDDEEDWWTP